MGFLKETNTKKLEVSALSLNVGHLRRLIDGREDNDKVDIHQSIADRPGEISTVSISIISERRADA